MSGSDIVFGIHVILLIVLIVLSFYVPLGLVILVILLHRMHLWYFDGCILTKADKNIGGMDKDSDFFQEIAYTFTGKEIGERGSHIIDMFILGFVLVVALSIAMIKGRRI